MHREEDWPGDVDPAGMWHTWGPHHMEHHIFMMDMTTHALSVLRRLLLVNAACDFDAATSSTQPVGKCTFEMPMSRMRHTSHN